MAVFPRPVTMMMFWTPEWIASSTPYWIKGLSTSGSISLGCALVAGRNRVPSPAAGKTALRIFAFINYSFYASRRIEWIESFDWIVCRREFYAFSMRLEDRSEERRTETDVSLLQRVSRVVNSDLSLDEMLGQIVGLTGQ